MVPSTKSLLCAAAFVLSTVPYAHGLKYIPEHGTDTALPMPCNSLRHLACHRRTQAAKRDMWFLGSQCVLLVHGAVVAFM